MKFFVVSLLIAAHALCQPLSNTGAPASPVKIKDLQNSNGAISSGPSKRSKTNKMPECTRIYGKGLRVCSAVHASGKMIDGVECNETLCKASCCNAARVCQKANFFSLSTEECISSRLLHDMGSCCVVGESTGSTMVYAGGAVGALIICSGLYFIVSMGSKKKVVKGEKPLDNEEESEETCKLYEKKTPHMKVNQLIATDADDVFWED